MTIYDVDKNVSKTITITQAGTYGNPLDVEANYVVRPVAAKLNGIYTGVTSAITAASLTNDGGIYGSVGGSSTSQGGAGGMGVSFTLSGDRFTNDYRMYGGAGGNSNGGGYGGYGGAGGAGVNLNQTGVLSDNTGVIAGGAGGSGTTNYGGGAGGTGVVLTGASLTNHGGFLSGIFGGAGGSNPGAGYGGSGGTAVSVGQNGLLEDTGIITGGTGGGGYRGGNAGTGVDLAKGGTLQIDTQFTYSISGGIGGAGDNHSAGNSSGGAGGTGIDVATGASITRESGATATISGGAGGTGFHGGTGGNGIDLAAQTNVTLDDTVTGGVGGAGYAPPAAGAYHGPYGQRGQPSSFRQFGDAGNGDAGTGGIGVKVTGATLTNLGSIKGGAGGFSEQTYYGGRGGVGVYLNGGTVTNAGYIGGGAGGTGSPIDHVNAPTTKYPGYAVKFGPSAGTLVAYYGGSFAALNQGGLIGGFKAGDVIDVTGVSPDTVQNHQAVDTSVRFSSFDTAATLQVTQIATVRDGTLNILGYDADQLTYTSDGNGGTLITVACYRRGTRIATVRGEIEVEHLAVGDWVVTASGDIRPVRWLGRRALACAAYADPAVVWPICIRAEAFAAHLPKRDLWVSPGHALLVDGMLMQADKLVNGATIVQVPTAHVEYWHVELDSHDVILAEGLAAESYLDTGNRTAFVNGGDFLELHPTFQPKHWSQTCVPLVLEGEALWRARAALLTRAEDLGHALIEANDAHVRVDGERVDPLYLSAERLAFILPPGGARIELCCRSFTPAQVLPRSEDGRALGLCVARLQLDGNELSLDDDSAFSAGWHGLERNDYGQPQRWSQARAPLPKGTRLVLIDLAGRGYYWDEGAVDPRFERVFSRLAASAE